MAHTKAQKAIEQFNDEVTATALSKIDKTALATTIATEVQRNITRNLKESLHRSINIGNLITRQLNNENTKTGRNFQGLMTEIANDMIKSIRTQRTE